jgi:peptidoglycan/LPS O-acetylase OafA/YrhL
MNKFAAKLLWRIGLLLLAAALATIGSLVVTDAAHGLRYTSLHSRLGAVALIMIGASYVSFQIVSRRRRDELVRGILLGGAFALWGTEQLLPSGRWTTAMDTAVIAIFVVDLAMITLNGLERPASQEGTGPPPISRSRPARPTA